MVGLVIVSHSRPLANALVNLIKQVSSPDAPIALAAGVGDDREDFGTDAIEIMEAIQSVASEDGVLVLMDLGSAVLSAQTALDLLPPEEAQKVRFCSAPLVEGAIAAGVQISLGNPIEVVAREAMQALTPKQEQLEEGPLEPETAPQANLPDSSAKILDLTLINLHGLHARPAARFVRLASQFKADVQVKNLANNKGPVTARSLNAIATLGAIEGHRIRVSASGEDASQALKALQDLVESGFGEAPAQAASPTPTETLASRPTREGVVNAVPVSEGYALAPLYHYEAALPPISTEPAQDPSTEWSHLQTALDNTRTTIEQRLKQLGKSLREADAAIFEAHILILQDPEIRQLARQAIFERRMNAAAAWKQSVDSIKGQYLALDDPYQKERAADVEDIGRQVLFTLSGKSPQIEMHVDSPVILFAEDLSPSETSQLDMRMVQGIITALGGPTSHSAILSRALGIPAVAGAGNLMIGLKSHPQVGLDGFSGEIYLDPSIEEAQQLAERRKDWLAERDELIRHSQTAAHTHDGRRVEVFANVGSLADASVAIQNGSEGVGLLRTEFLYLTREEAPSEEEQYQVLAEFYQAFGPDRPITVRTMDIGGDKPLAYMHLPEEKNPFLGMRALRISLEQPDLFIPQLRAILRAAAGSPCRIMFPMVADIDEFRRARQWVEKVHAQLSSEGVAHAWPVEIGIMVEIPSAALLSQCLAAEVDFFSIGTNDLTQYTLAAERGNPGLAYLADAMHPAVLKLIGQVAQNAHAAGKWVGICGELGGDPVAIPVLVGLGIDELSMNAPAIPRAKSILNQINSDEVQALAEKVLRASTADESRCWQKSLLNSGKSGK